MKNFEEIRNRSVRMYRTSFIVSLVSIATLAIFFILAGINDKPKSYHAFLQWPAASLQQSRPAFRDMTSRSLVDTVGLVIAQRKDSTQVFPARDFQSISVHQRFGGNDSSAVKYKIYGTATNQFRSNVPKYAEFALIDSITVTGQTHSFGKPMQWILTDGDPAAFPIFEWYFIVAEGLAANDSTYCVLRQDGLDNTLQ